MQPKVIKPFKLDGEFADDSFALLTKVATEQTLVHMIKDKGYLPVIDIDPIWLTSYEATNDKWHFSMVIYAAYVGKRKSWAYQGISQNKLIPLNTHQRISRL